MQNRPNILLITADQLRWDAIESINPAIKTPNLNALADRGTVFERAYAVNPVCTPSRVSILTGQMPSKHGCYHVGTSLPEDYPTIAHLFSQSNYHTAIVGKAHFQACLGEKSFESGPNIYNEDFFRNWHGPYYGFQKAELVIGHTLEKHGASMHYRLWLKDNGIDIDKYFGNNDYRDFGSWGLSEEYHGSRWTADKTIDEIDASCEAEKPFFIWSSFQDPHNPFFVPEPWDSMYNPDSFQLWDTVENEMEDKPPFYTSIIQGKGLGDDPDLQYRNWADGVPLKYLMENDIRRIKSIYYGMVSLMDHHMGRIIAHLRKTGALENTIIVFTSDHGEYLGNHGLWGKGLPAYEDIHRIPFIVSLPNQRAVGKKSHAIQSQIDIPATFLDFAGIPMAAGMQGLSQRKTWEGSGASTRDAALVEFRPAQSPFFQLSYIEKKYKLVLYHDRKYGELYDLEKDDTQLQNLWDNREFEEVKNRLIRSACFSLMEYEGTLRERSVPA